MGKVPGAAGQQLAGMDIATLKVKDYAGFGNEFRGATIAGRDALCEVGERWHKTRRFVFSGSELNAMSLAMECHDTQFENIRAIDVDRAADEVLHRILHGVNATNVRAELAREQFAE